MKKNAKAEKVLDVALGLLKNEGDYGVTMRKVASLADMSLSNVQYYFKNKDMLLKAMADRYFQSCLEEIRTTEAIQSQEALQGDLEALLKSFLRHGLEVTEMCRLFREYWAISTRNEAIDDYIKQYYREMVVILSEKLRPVANSESGLSKSVSMIIPFVEGYSITALSMPEDINSVTDILISLVTNLLEGLDE